MGELLSNFPDPNEQPSTNSGDFLPLSALDDHLRRTSDAANVISELISELHLGLNPDDENDLNSYLFDLIYTWAEFKDTDPDRMVEAEQKLRERFSNSSQDR